MNLLMPVRFLPLLLVLTMVGARIHAADLTSHPTAGNSQIEVRIRMVLVDLEKINGADQNFTANLAYSARWSDPRLRHAGPGAKTVALADIWHPRLQLVNRQRLQETLPNEARVSPEGEVVVIQRVWGNFSQPLILQEFPFDRQELQVDLVGVGQETGAVTFLADAESPSAVLADLSISDWEVTGWSAETAEWALGIKYPSRPGFRLTVSVERNYRYHLVNTILPLVMITCMSWVVFWINPGNANPRISVSVTAMLTLIAYRFAVSTSLPKIAYLTRMDWFILGASVLVFASLLEVVVTSWFADKDRLGTANKINRAMRIIAPVAFALVAWGSLT